MARNTNLNVAPGGGGGGGARVGRGAPKIKVSGNVSVKPKGKMTDAEVNRLKAINAPKSDSNAGRAKAATKAANKDVVSKPMPKASRVLGGKIVGQPKQVSKAKAAKIKASGAKTTAKANAKRTKEMDEYNKFIADMKKYQGR